MQLAGDQISIKKYKINKSFSLLANNCFQCPIFHLFFRSACKFVCFCRAMSVVFLIQPRQQVCVLLQPKLNCLIQPSKEAGFTRVAWMTRSPFISYSQSNRLMHGQQPKPCIITDKQNYGGELRGRVLAQSPITTSQLVRLSVHDMNCMQRLLYC